MERNKLKTHRRLRRRRRSRKRSIGNPERPRLAVFRSVKHIYAQIIDDESGRTMLTSSTLHPDVRKGLKITGNSDAAEVVGKDLGKRALEAGVKKVIFDRGGFKFHGRVAALAKGARAAGLEF